MNLIESIDDLLVEKIQHAPRVGFPKGVERYIKIQVRAFSGYIPKLEAMSKAVDRLDKLDRSVVRDLERDWDIDTSSLTGRKIEELISLLKSIVRNYGSLGSGDFKTNASFVFFDFEDATREAKYVISDTLDIFKNPDTFNWGMKEFMDNNAGDEREWKDFARDFIPGIVALHEFIARVKSETAKIEEWIKSFRHDYKPAHEKVETLYHASTNAVELGRKGFELGVVRSSQAGLGWHGSPDHLSFTSDLFIAKEIARTLKEVIQIAKGKVKSSDIYDWAKREGGEALDLVKSWIEEEKPKKGGWDFENARMKPDPTPEQIGKWFRDPHTAMQMYNRYLWGQKTRYNPVYAGMSDPGFTRAFAKLKESNVGVLKCTVDMTQSVSYHKAEREFRVPPEAVLSIDKVIR